MSSAEQTRVPMPRTLVVSLVILGLVLLVTAAAFARVALFVIVSGALLGYVGIVVWLVVAISTVLVMAGKSRARYGLILLPLGLGALAAAAGGVGIFWPLLVGTALAVVAVLLTFHSSSRAYFAGRTRGAAAIAS